MITTGTTGHEIISADVLSENVLGAAAPAVISAPTLNSPEQVREVVTAWRHNAGKAWPKAVNVAALAANLKLIYVAHWLISGYGWVEWRGETHRKTNKYDYQVIPQNGVATTELAEFIKENIHPRSGLKQLKCGARAVTAPRLPIDQAQAAQLPVLLPQGYEAAEQAARSELKRILRKKAQAAAMALQALHCYEVTPPHLERLKVSVWLYPIYLGHYDSDGESLSIQIDAISSAIYVEPPKPIREARRENVLLAVLTAAALVVMAALVMVLMFKIRF